jgi:hypothetical protein
VIIKSNLKEGDTIAVSFNRKSEGYTYEDIPSEEEAQAIDEG